MQIHTRQLYKTPEQLDYSRPLDGYKWSDYPEVNTFVDAV